MTARRVAIALLLSSVGACAAGTAGTSPPAHRPATGSAEGARDPGSDGIAAFTSHARFTEAKLSPRGTYLAAITQQQGRRSLVFVNLATRQRTAFLKPQSTSVVGDFHWANDERVVVELVDDDGDLAAPVSRGELYAVDATGRGGRLIFGYRAGGLDAGSRVPHAERERAWAHVVSALPGDERRMLIATTSMHDVGDRRAELYRIDVYTGAKTLVARSPIPEAVFLADEQGEVRIAAGFDEQVELRAYLREPGQGWRELSTVKGFGRHAVPRGYVARDRVLYVEEPAAGQFGLYAVKVDTGERKLVARNPDVPARSLLFDRATRRLLAAEYEPDLPSWEFLEPEHPVSQVLRGLLAAYPRDHVRLVSLTRDERRAVVLVESDRDPGQFLLVDVERRSAEPIVATRPWIRPEAMLEQSAFHITAGDGFRIHGYFTLPPRKKLGDRPPLVVLPHGGPHFVRDHWRFAPEVQLLAHAGFAVLQVNYRGSGGYGLGYQEAGYRHWGDRMVQDVVDATRWAIGKGLGDAGRICTYGASFGGYAAMQAAILAPELFRCAVGYAGIYDLTSGLGDVGETSLGRGYLRTAVGEDPAALRSASPLFHAEALRAKVLLIHGRKDRRAPFDQAQRFGEALAARGRPPEWVIEPNEGHGFYDEGARERLYTRLIAFLEENTAPAGPPIAAPRARAELP